MRVQIQLLTEQQKHVRISTMVVPSTEKERLPQFDSVSIEAGGPHSPGLTILVPLGKGEALAQAFREVLK